MPVQLDYSYGIQPYDKNGNVEPPRKSALLRLSPDALAAIAGGAKVQVEYDGNGIPVLSIDGQRYPLKSLSEPAHHEVHVRVYTQGPKAKSAPFLQYGTIKSKLKVDPTIALPPPIAVVNESTGSQSIPSNLTPAEAAIARVSKKTHREREERKEGRMVILDEPPVPSASVPSGKRRPGSGTKRPPTGSSNSALGSRVASPAPGHSTPAISSAVSSAPAKTDPTLEGRLFRLLVQKGASKENDIIKWLTGTSHPEAGLRKGILSKLNEMATKSGKSGTSKTPDLYELKKGTWLSARPWEMEGVPDADRERLARLVVNKLEELGVPPTDPVWKALRPPTPPNPPPIRAARSPVPPPAAGSSAPATTAPTAKAALKAARGKDKDPEVARDGAPTDRPVKKQARPNPNLPARPSSETVALAKEKKTQREAEKPITAKDEGARTLKEREHVGIVANAAKAKIKAERRPSPSMGPSSSHRIGDSGLPSSASQDLKKPKPAIPSRDSALSTSPTKSSLSVNPSKRPRELDAPESHLKVSSSNLGATQRERNAISPQPGTSPRPRPTHTRAPLSTSSLADIVPDPKYLPNEAIKGKIPRHVKDEEEEGEIEEPISSKRRRVEDAEKAQEAERERERERERAIKRERRDKEDRDRDRQHDRGRDRERDSEREKDKDRDRWDRERERGSGSRYSSDSHRRDRDGSPVDIKRSHRPPLTTAEMQERIDALKKENEKTVKKRSESPPSKMDQLQKASKKVKRESSPAMARSAQSKAKEKVKSTAMKAKAESLEPPVRIRDKDKKRLERDVSPMAGSERTASSQASTKPFKRRSPVYTSSSEDEDDTRGHSPPKARKIANGTSAASAANRVHTTAEEKSLTYQRLYAELRRTIRSYNYLATKLGNEKSKLEDLLDRLEGEDNVDSGISISDGEELMDSDELGTDRGELDRLNNKMKRLRLEIKGLVG